MDILIVLGAIWLTSPLLYTTSSILSRAVDVCMKERRGLMLMVREIPLHAGHLKRCSLSRYPAASSHLRFPPSTRSHNHWKKWLAKL